MPNLSSFPLITFYIPLSSIILYIVSFIILAADTGADFPGNPKAWITLIPRSFAH